MVALDLFLEIAIFLLQFCAQPRDLLVRQHVLDGEPDLRADLFEQPDILCRVPMRRRTPDGQRSRGAFVGAEWDDHVRANPSRQ